jgi:hypothetical protein
MRITGRCEPVVSLRSTTGYKLLSFQDTEVVYQL